MPFEVTSNSCSMVDEVKLQECHAPDVLFGDLENGPKKVIELEVYLLIL